MMEGFDYVIMICVIVATIVLISLPWMGTINELQAENDALRLMNSSLAANASTPTPFQEMTALALFDACSDDNRALRDKLQDCQDEIGKEKNKWLECHYELSWCDWDYRRFRMDSNYTVSEEMVEYRDMCRAMGYVAMFCMNGAQG